MAEQVRCSKCGVPESALVRPFVGGRCVDRVACAARVSLGGVVGVVNIVELRRAVREVDALFGGSPGRWTLDGRMLTDRAADALLSLHGHLLDLDAAALDVRPELAAAEAPGR